MKFSEISKSANGHADSDSAAPRQSVVFVMPTEAAAIDSFVEELRSIDRNQAREARLRGTTSG